MATLEDEINDLKEKNSELAQKVQYWKMTAAEKENEKLNLMKEMNELRLKLSRLQNTSDCAARKLDAALQMASEKAISHLVIASNEIARGMEIAKAYMRDREEIDIQTPRWSTLGGTPATERKEKVHRVPPMMLGGQSLQPVVALSRTMLNTSNPRSEPRSPNRSVTQRAVPLHMLQDVYIPLTRINVPEPVNNIMDTDSDVNADDSTEALGLEDDEERLDESAHRSDEDNGYSGRRLHALSEEESAMEDMETQRLSLHMDNPLEGPSWLLDSPPDSNPCNTNGRVNLEPDSTTELDRSTNTSCDKIEHTPEDGSGGVSLRLSCEFSPTVRRRKRTSTPPSMTPRQHHYSPRPSSSRRNSGRVLKVLVAKMRLDSDNEGTSPLKRVRSPLQEPLVAFDAPSPNGATDSAVIVSETLTHLFKKAIKTEPSTFMTRRDSHDKQRARLNSQDNRANRISQENRANRMSQENRANRISQENRANRISQDSRANRISQDNRANRISQDNQAITISQDNLASRLSQENRISRLSQDVTASIRSNDIQENITYRTKSRDGQTNRVRSRLGSQDRDSAQRSRVGSHDSHDSDSGSGGTGDSMNEGRTRRPRKMVTYKEKPLNRKLRR